MLPHKVLVEGPDDCHVLRHLIGRHTSRSRAKAINIEVSNGIDTLLGDLPLHLQDTTLKCLGVIVDADEDIEARWQALSQIITQAGEVDFPQQPDASGTIIEVNLNQTHRPIKVGLWLMPNNKLSGMLEDFIKFLVPTRDKLWSQVEACLTQIPDADFPFDIASRNKVAWQRKAKIHTWLAWQEEPGKPLGQAITKRFVDPQAKEAQDLVNWLRQLLNMD